MLINCAVYRQGQKVAAIAIEEIDRHLGRDDEFVWMALKDTTHDELEHAQREFGLHPLAVEDAKHGHQRPKVEEYGDQLFAVLQTLECDESNRLTVGEVDVFVGPSFVLTVRNRSTHDLMPVRERAEHEPQLLRQGPGFVLYAVMDSIVDSYFAVIEQLEEELETIENRIFTHGAARSNIQRLYDLKRRLTKVRHVVIPLLESTGKLWSGRVPPVCERNREYFRDVYDHLTRIGATLEAVRETIATAIQVNLSMVAIDDSETTKKLAAWAGIFAVATAFAGIWGMNFEHMPELKWVLGYPSALLAIACTCGALWWRFRRAGWL